MRDTSIVAHYTERPPHGSSHLLATFAGCIAAAALVGLLFDRVGMVRTSIFLGCATFFLLGLRNFRIFAALVVFILPFVPTTFLSKAVTGLSGQRIIGMAILLTAMAVFIAAALRPGRFRFPAWRPAFYAYLFVFIFAALNGARHVQHIPPYFHALGVMGETTALGYLQITLFAPGLIIAAAYVMSLVAANTRSAAWIAVPLFASAALLSIALVIVANGASSTMGDLAQQESRRYLSVLGPHANELGLMLNMALALSLCSLGEARRRTTVLWLGLVSLLLAAAVVLTFSRGAFLGLLVVSIHAVCVRRDRIRLIAILACIGLAVVALSDAVIDRVLHGIGGNDLDLISSGRIDEIWLPLLPEIFRHPVVGSGHGSIMWSEAAQSRSILPVGHPHSAYLGLLLDVGFVGTIVTAAFLVHMWRMFWRTAHQASAGGLRGFFLGAAACIPLLLVQGLTDDSFMPGFTHAYLWLAYGAAVGVGARSHHFVRPREATALATVAKDTT